MLISYCLEFTQVQLSQIYSFPIVLHLLMSSHLLIAIGLHYSFPIVSHSFIFHCLTFNHLEQLPPHLQHSVIGSDGCID